MKGLLMRLSGFVLACVLGIMLFLFAMELLLFRNSSYKDLRTARLSLEGNAFSVSLSSEAPLQLFKGYDYRVEGDALYLTVYSGDFYTSPRCLGWPVVLRIQDPALEEVSQVFLQDGGAARKIYPE